MLFDVDPKLIKTLMREQKVGMRDAVVKPKILGPNELTYVGAKSMRGVEFVKFLESKLPKVVLDFDMDEEEDEEETGEEGAGEGEALDNPYDPDEGDPDDDYEIEEDDPE